MCGFSEMNRLFMLTRAEGSTLTPQADDAVVLLGAATALLWQSAEQPWLTTVAERGHLFALAQELATAQPPLPVIPLADHRDLLDLVLRAPTVIGSR